MTAFETYMRLLGVQTPAEPLADADPSAGTIEGPGRFQTLLRLLAEEQQRRDLEEFLETVGDHVYQEARAWFAECRKQEMER